MSQTTSLQCLLSVTSIPTTCAPSHRRASSRHPPFFSLHLLAGVHIPPSSLCLLAPRLCVKVEVVWHICEPHGVMSMVWWWGSHISFYVEEGWVGEVVADDQRDEGGGTRRPNPKILIEICCMRFLDVATITWFVAMSFFLLMSQRGWFCCNNFFFGCYWSILLEMEVETKVCFSGVVVAYFSMLQQAI